MVVGAHEAARGNASMRWSDRARGEALEWVVGGRGSNTASSDQQLFNMVCT